MLIYNLLLTARYRLRGIHLAKLHGAAEEKFICLTFDDGPSSHTEKLLELLKVHDIKATFFVVASFAREYPDTIERIKSEGHAIGLHSFEHKCPLIQDEEYTRHAFDRSMQILEKLQIKPRLFRPAWGTFNRTNVAKCKEFGLTPVLWNVMAEDWQANTTSDVIFKKLIKRTGTGDVVCLHDGRGENDAPSRTIAALERAIPMWKRRGYSFLTIEEVFYE